MSAERLEQTLFNKGLCSSREKALQEIKAAHVFVDGKLATKAAQLIDENANITLEKHQTFVSKGGFKLEKAIQTFKLDFSNKTVLDVGCSTGGFTDCTLQHGAKFVFGIDVGSNQLATSLQNSPQLKSIENLHVKDLSLSQHLNNQLIDIVVVDVSFISLTHVFPFLVPVLKPEGEVLCLIKPQFELSQSDLDNNGIVRSVKRQLVSLSNVIDAAKNNALNLQAIDYVPFMEWKKNIEFIARFSKEEQKKSIDLKNIVTIANAEKRKLKAK